MLLRNPCRSAIAFSALALLAACHGHHSSSGPGTTSATSFWSAATGTRGEFAPITASPFVAITGLGDDFELQAGASFVEDSNGRAYLSAVLARESAPDARVALRIAFGNVLAPEGRDYEQKATPRMELAPEAYRSLGGPVDVTTWRYYGVSGGELRGLGSLAGAFINLTAADVTGLQCGLGADNLDVAVGASVRLAGTGSLGESLAPITLSFTMRTSERTYATTSPGDAVLGGSPRATLSIPALGGEFHVISGGSFIERVDGTLRFDAVLADADATDRRFALTLFARDRREPFAGSAVPSGSPHVELFPSAYTEALGPIDTDSWRYYAAFDGVLHGLEALAGAEISVRSGTFAVQVGYGASGVDGEFGAAASLTLLVVAQPLDGSPLPWGAADGVLRATLRRAFVATADEPEVDPDFGTLGGFALRIPGLADDFVVAAGGEYCERADGRAEFFAELASLANPDEQWTLALDLSERIDTGDVGGIPPGSPVLRLADGAYATNGGPIEPGEWHYYRGVVGELRGIGPRAGARIDLIATSPATQVGKGANGSNLRSGLFGTMSATLVNQPTVGATLPESLGTAELLLTLERLGDRCVTTPTRDASVSPLLGGVALSLPGIGSDFVVLPGSRFAERADGSAELHGVVARASNTSQRFLASLRFEGRVDRSTPAPENSPWLELATSAYVEAGGTVDPTAWHYYLSTTGNLIGLAAWQGATLRVTEGERVLQVGTGASGRNARYGAAGSVVIEVLAQPSSGAALSSSAAGELHFSLFDACP